MATADGTVVFSNRQTSPEAERAARRARTEMQVQAAADAAEREVANAQEEAAAAIEQARLGYTSGHAQRRDQLAAMEQEVSAMRAQGEQPNLGALPPVQPGYTPATGVGPVRLARGGQMLPLPPVPRYATGGQSPPVGQMRPVGQGVEVWDGLRWVAFTDKAAARAYGQEKANEWRAALAGQVDPNGNPVPGAASAPPATNATWSVTWMGPDTYAVVFSDGRELHYSTKDPEGPLFGQAPPADLAPGSPLAGSPGSVVSGRATPSPSQPEIVWTSSETYVVRFPDGRVANYSTMDPTGPAYGRRPSAEERPAPGTRLETPLRAGFPIVAPGDPVPSPMPQTPAAVPAPPNVSSDWGAWYAADPEARGIAFGLGWAGEKAAPTTAVMPAGGQSAAGMDPGYTAALKTRRDDEERRLREASAWGADRPGYAQGGMTDSEEPELESEQWGVVEPNAVVGEGENPAGPGENVELVIYPQAVADGTVVHTDGARALHLPPGTIIIPLPPRLHAMARKATPVLDEGLPVEKRGRDIIPKGRPGSGAELPLPPTRVAKKRSA